MPDAPEDPIEKAFKDAMNEGSQPQPGQPFPMPFICEMVFPPPPATKPTLTKAGAERVWHNITTARRVSGASLTCFAACTGFMPTLQAAKELINRFGVGFMPESWTLEPAFDRLGKDRLYAWVDQPPEILARDFPAIVGGPEAIIIPCPICGVHFQAGDYARGVPFKSFGPESKGPRQPCGNPGCECHTRPDTGERLATVLIHAHHLFEADDAAYCADAANHSVPLPTPAQKREARRIEKRTAMLKKSWRWGWLYRCLILFCRAHEWGVEKGWWAAADCRTF